MGWAFNKDSELLQIINYNLDKMRQTGVTRRLRKKFLGNSNTDGAPYKTQAQDMTGIGYENVAFPFLSLLAGLCVALLQLGIEVVSMCKKKYLDTEKHSTEDKGKSEKAEDIIEDIHDLLKENHGNLGGIIFLSKIRMLSTVRNSPH